MRILLYTFKASKLEKKQSFHHLQQSYHREKLARSAKQTIRTVKTPFRPQPFALSLRTTHIYSAKKQSINTCMNSENQTVVEITCTLSQ